MTHFYVLDANDKPVREPDLVAWARFMEGAGRHVAQDRIGDVYISTVFLGLDHGWGAQRPVLWETMVFGSKLDETQERYTTREEALAGHRRWVNTRVPQ
jgi:hypothetical protein